MSVDEAIVKYGELAQRVFSEVKSPLSRDGRFSATKFEEVIKEIVFERTGNADERMMDTRSEGACKTYAVYNPLPECRGADPSPSFVCAMPALDIAAGTPRLFRTYRAPKNETFDCTIWEAARATTAAPTFFKRITIGTLGSSQSYVDGGLGCNNPVMQVLEEAVLMFPGRHLSCVISIGTGKAQMIKIPPPTLLRQTLPSNVVKAMRGIATDSERNAQDMMRRFQGAQNVYFRFNVEQGLQKVRLDQWERLDEVTAHSEQYMANFEVDQKLELAVIAVMEKQNVVSPRQIGKILV